MCIFKKRLKNNNQEETESLAKQLPDDISKAITAQMLEQNKKLLKTNNELIRRFDELIAIMRRR